MADGRLLGNRLIDFFRQEVGGSNPILSICVQRVSRVLPSKPLFEFHLHVSGKFEVLNIFQAIRYYVKYRDFLCICLIFKPQ